MYGPHPFLFGKLCFGCFTIRLSNFFNCSLDQRNDLVLSASSDVCEACHERIRWQEGRGSGAEVQREVVLLTFEVVLLPSEVVLLPFEAVILTFEVVLLPL